NHTLDDTNTNRDLAMCRCSNLLYVLSELIPLHLSLFDFFFFIDTATTEIYTLSLHDALPISPVFRRHASMPMLQHQLPHPPNRRDRKSTRLNSSHRTISYAVFCLKKKKRKIHKTIHL